MDQDRSWHPKQKPFSWRPMRHTFVKNAKRFRIPFLKHVYLLTQQARRREKQIRQQLTGARIICPYGRKTSR